MKRRALLACFLAVVGAAAIHAQQVGPNISAITGTGALTGDPFLRQQNEPFVAVSPLNPEHLIVVANDSRSIDIVAQDGTGEPSQSTSTNPPKNDRDNWIGIYFSYDGGRSYYGGLVPGSPAGVDDSPASKASPVRGLSAASDPVVVFDTLGHAYVGFLAFTRGGMSKIAVARYTDHNNAHGTDTILYDFTSEVDKGSGSAAGAGSSNGVFLDKLWMAVDVPRMTGATAASQGNAYIAYTQFDGLDKGSGHTRSQLKFARSTDGGKTWSNPIKLNTPNEGHTNIRNHGNYVTIDPRNGDVYVYWRDYYELAIDVVRSTDGGKTFTKPHRLADAQPVNGQEVLFAPFQQPGIADQQPSTEESRSKLTFRAPAFPVVTIDGEGWHYIAIQEFSGQTSRIKVRVTKDPMVGYPSPVVAVNTHLDDSPVPAVPPPDTVLAGPQFFPSIKVANGLVTLLYLEGVPKAGDLVPGLDNTTHWMSGIDREINAWVAQAIPSDTPVFNRVQRASLYAYDPFKAKSYWPEQAPNDNRIERSRPNLPMYKSGTSAFFGDYTGLAAYVDYVRGDAPPGCWAASVSKRSERFALAMGD